MRCTYCVEIDPVVQDQPAGKFKVGDKVFVPNAFDWSWKPEITMVEKTAVENDNIVYYARCLYQNPVSNNAAIEKQWYIFNESEVFATSDECKEYISNHYYGGLCRGCKYDDIGGAIYFCNDCGLCKLREVTGENHGELICSRTGITVGNKYSIRKSEICKYYIPMLPQHKAEYGSWEKYDDVLKNCDFNPKCRHHSESAHKTCTYEFYMGRIVVVPYSFEFNGREVKAIRIRRSQWINQSFIDVENNVIKCLGLDYNVEWNSRGKPKKECYPLNEWFGEITTIDVTNGKIC